MIEHWHRTHSYQKSIDFWYVLLPIVSLYLRTRLTVVLVPYYSIYLQ